MDKDVRVTHVGAGPRTPDTSFLLTEKSIYRKRGERVEEALYRDFMQREARQKLISDAVINIKKVLNICVGRHFKLNESE